MPDPTMGTAALCVTRIDTVGGVAVGTSIPATAVWNAAEMRWEVTYTTTGFSVFICHTCNPGNAALAIKLLNFTAQKVGSTSLVKWTTATEVNNKHFNVLHSTTGADFVQVGASINSKALNGNSISPLSYSYVHANPILGKNYYQLQSVDAAGKASLSDVREVYFSEGSAVTIYPNPAVSELHVDVNVGKTTQATIKVLDMAGRVIRTIETDLVKGLNSNIVDLSGIAAGVYMVQITDGKTLNYSQQFKKD
jgi:hypothetical protein